MFKSNINLAEEDLDLGTSFGPISSSTQVSCGEKRKNEVCSNENPKKAKSNTNLSTKYSSFLSNKVVTRTFPGPAGLLPNNIGMSSALNTQHCKDSTEGLIFCSQHSVSTFDKEPWTMMTEDFSSLHDEQLYEIFTINWIKKKYCQKKILDNYKAPFLAGVIESIEVVDGKNPSVHVTLKDTTGSINGVILYSFYKENSTYLTAGSVLVLKQFGVLSTQEGQCLTITSNNVLVIYHVRDPNKENVNTEYTGIVEKIELQQIKVEDIWKGVNAIKVTKSHMNNLNVNSNPPFATDYNRSCSVNKANSKDIAFNQNSKNDSCQQFNANCSDYLVPKFTKITDHNLTSNSKLHTINSLQPTVQSGAKKKCDSKKVGLNEIKKNENIVISCSQLSVKVDKKDSDIWKAVLEDIDSDSLFGDF